MLLYMFIFVMSQTANLRVSHDFMGHILPYKVTTEITPSGDFVRIRFFDIR